MHKINSFGLAQVAEIKLSFNLFFFCQKLYDDTLIFFVIEVIWLLYRYCNSDCYILATEACLGGHCAMPSLSTRPFSKKEQN